jgi:hypothetical protein
LKSIIKENGKAVIPIAPQQARMGYPIKQSIPIKKQGTDVSIEKVVCSGVVLIKSV